MGKIRGAKAVLSKRQDATAGTDSADANFTPLSSQDTMART
jgi:hypothetical protein